MGRPSHGAVYALVSAALFGVSTPLAKSLLGDVGPWMLAGLLYLGSGVGLAAYRAVYRLSGRRPGEAALTTTDLPRLAAVVLAGGVIAPALLMVGLSYTPASTASLLLNLEGLFTLGIAWIVFHENVDFRIAIGAGAILTGALLLSWTEGPEGLGWGAGAIAIAGACLAWGIDNNLTRRLSSADPLQIAMVKGMVAGITNVGLAWSAWATFPETYWLVAAAGVGFLGYGVSLALFVMALRHLGSARTGAYFSLAPFAGAGVSLAAFGEPVSLRLGLAAALMAFGLYLHLAERHVHHHRHDVMVHDHRHVHDEHHQHDHVGDEGPEPHSHLHVHASLEHSHAHFPDIHHRHGHG